ncbi:FAD/FMN-containing dehydrogenase [Kibdelosporangium banguiense]|uniref:FAD/FMN-containing dehydrogenase n=1 Tax=Kibdelosporangium banguiense TaxID=1365924 RepID=A0ABS4TM21_9PSEU|nr:FAD-binding oxidoreductase [Kibdelosporangium banguiense]MBP2325010.1 FAD/FMN-containing dehydrogenase [Kibdelosporangium banguiense]
MTLDVSELARNIAGPVLKPGDKGYEQETAGMQTAFPREPDVVVGATGPNDVRAAVRFAVDNSLPVAVQGTGHAFSTLRGGLLVNTSRMNAIEVHPRKRTVRFEAGVRWAQVVEATAPHGLAPLSGSAPNVGAMAYTLAGGMSLMGRKYGYAADHVRQIDVVTADGRYRHVTVDNDPDLFWALRGGRDNFGIATAAEVDLVEVDQLYGGGLFFDGSIAGDVVPAWRRWTDDLPDEMTSSLGVVPFPDIPPIPEPLRGKHVVHIRIAFLGDAATGEKLVAPLLTAGSRLMEGLREMPYTEAGTIYNDPTDPMPYHGTNAMLSDLDDKAIQTLLENAGPGAQHKFILELRHMGGAYGREPEVPNAVNHRDAAYALGALSRIGPVDLPTAVSAHADLANAMAPWSIGCGLNFTYGDASPDDVRAVYNDQDYRRLTELKSRYDPENLFRLNYNIPPAR